MDDSLVCCFVACLSSIPASNSLRLRSLLYSECCRRYYYVIFAWVLKYCMHIRFLFYGGCVPFPLVSNNCGDLNILQSRSPSPNHRVGPVPDLPRKPSFSRVVSFCPSLARGCQKRGTPNSSGSPTCDTFSHGADSRPGVSETEANGSTSSSTDKYATSPSEGEQIQGTLRVQRPDQQQVNALGAFIHPHLTIQHTSYRVYL